MLSVTCTNKVLADEAAPHRCALLARVVATNPKKPDCNQRSPPRRGQTNDPAAGLIACAERHLASGAPAPGTGGGVYKAGQGSSDRATTAE